MIIAEKLIQEGFRQGINQGIQQGLQKAALSIFVEGYIIGYIEGFQQGYIQCRYELIQKMMENDVPIEKISKVIGMQIEEINTLIALFDSGDMPSC